MIVRDILNSVAISQEIKLLDRGDEVFVGYRSGVYNDKWLNNDVNIIFCGRDGLLVIDME